MATAPHIKPELTDPELERSQVFVPSKKANLPSVVLDVDSTWKIERNPGDVKIQRQREIAYGVGRRRKSRKLRRKIRKTRKYRK
jgi:hypothetical protein